MENALRKRGFSNKKRKKKQIGIGLEFAKKENTFLYYWSFILIKGQSVWIGTKEVGQNDRQDCERI